MKKLNEAEQPEFDALKQRVFDIKVGTKIDQTSNLSEQDVWDYASLWWENLDISGEQVYKTDTCFYDLMKACGVKYGDSLLDVESIDIATLRDTLGIVEWMYERGIRA